MRAVVYHGPGQKSWDEVPDPKIEDDADAIVRIDTVTICGTDLHILKGDVPEVTPGRILGHEAVGTVDETGMATRSVKAGRPGPPVVHLGVRPMPLLSGGTVRPVPGRRWLDLRSPHRRGPGRVRQGPVRRHLHLQGPRGPERRAGAVPRPTSFPPATRSGC